MHARDASFGNSALSTVMQGIFIPSAPEGYVDARVERVPSMVHVRGIRHYEGIPTVPWVMV